jgi:hypothetical protein
MDDDLVWTDVSRSPYLRISSSSPGDLNVSKVGQDWQLVVPVGASTIAGATPVLTSRLTDSCATVLSNTGYGYAKTNLSVPIAIVVTSSASSIARPTTPAVTTLGIGTSAQLTVTVTFRAASGTLSYIPFTSDARTVYTPSYSSCTGTVSVHGLVALDSATGAGTAGSVTVSVTMPSYSAATGLTGSITIPVVDVNTAIPLTGSLVHSDTPAVPVTAQLPLAQFACTGCCCCLFIYLFIYYYFFFCYVC